MRPSFLFAVSVVALTMAASSIGALAQGTAAPGKTAATAKADNAAISSCLQEVFKEAEKYEKLSDKEKEKADEPAEAASCMGTVSGVCQEKIKGDPNKGLVTCNNRELAVWQAFMDRRVAAYLKDAKPNEAAAMKKVQSTWVAHRDARCAYPAIDSDDKGLASALTSACLLEMTSKQALWIDAREN